MFFLFSPYSACCAGKAANTGIKQVNGLSFFCPGAPEGHTSLLHCFPAFLAILFLALSLISSSAVAKAASATTLKSLQTEIETLGKDTAKAGQRHNWLQLDKKITAFAVKSKGDAKVEASYLSARCLEELGKRSHSKADNKAAVERYMKVATSFPKHKLAPASRYAAVGIAATSLKDPEMARELADKLKAANPSSAEAGKVDALVQTAQKASGAASVSGKGKDKAVTAKKTKTQEVASRAEQLGLAVKTVMLDPGHGGKDPGAQVTGLDERNLTLEMAKILGAELKKNGFEVLYTRSGNTYIGLDKRTEKANASKADLFISIHANANNNPKMHGLETYYLSPATSTDASKVAARENSVSISQVNDVQFILADLMLDTKLEESRTLAKMVHKNVLSRVAEGKYKLHDNGARPAPFYVLLGAKMPAILLEMGYMTNADDLKLLKTQDFLLRQAQGVVKGIVEYRAYVQKGME